MAKQQQTELPVEAAEAAQAEEDTDLADTEKRKVNRRPLGDDLKAMHAIDGIMDELPPDAQHLVMQRLFAKYDFNYQLAPNEAQS